MPPSPLSPDIHVLSDVVHHLETIFLITMFSIYSRILRQNTIHRHAVSHIEIDHLIVAATHLLHERIELVHTRVVIHLVF